MKKKIAMVTGGFSGEIVVSHKSAKTIFDNIDRDLFEPYYIDITKQGWHCVDEAGNRSAVDRNDFSISVNGEKVHFDAVLMGMHGAPGEDGKLLGYFDMIGMPYTSCDASTSALTFNKRYTVAVAAFAGINVAKSVHLFKQVPVTSAEILKNISLPVFVKPNNGGSSIGMSKVEKAEDLDAAIEKAYAEDDQLLIEEFISGRELTIGVFNNNGEVIALPMTEIISKNNFFDFQAKYEGASIEVTPAEVSEEVKMLVEETAKKVYAVFNCRGIVRIDFIYNAENNRLFMLEINTVPGQTNESLVPQQVRAYGWTLKQFYTALIQQSLNA